MPPKRTSRQQQPVKTTLRLPKNLHLTFRMAALASGCTMNRLAIHALRTYLSTNIERLKKEAVDEIFGASLEFAYSQIVNENE